MSEAVERLRAANRYEMKLANGIPITYRLPYMQELVIAGLLPLTLLDELRKRLEAGGTETEAESVAEQALSERLSDFGTEFEAKQRVVSLMVDSVDGEAAELTPEETLEIPPEDFSALITAAMSRTPVGRAEGEA